MGFRFSDQTCLICTEIKITLEDSLFLPKPSGPPPPLTQNSLAGKAVATVYWLTEQLHEVSQAKAGTWETSPARKPEKTRWASASWSAGKIRKPPTGFLAKLGDKLPAGMSRTLTG